MSVPWNCLLFSLTNLVSVSQIGKLRAARGRIKGDETTFARGQPRAFSLSRVGKTAEHGNCASSVSSLLYKRWDPTLYSLALSRESLYKSSVRDP